MWKKWISLLLALVLVIGTVPTAQAYRDILLENQEEVQDKISTAIGKDLDAVWNLTLAANVISANIRWGDMEKIAATPGVSEVVPETLYEPCATIAGDAGPTAAAATTMTGSVQAWQAGYTGAGTRIAIIDTGLDTDHQSVDNAAFLYALAEDAEAAGYEADAYIQSLHLLDTAEIAGILPQLNICKDQKLDAQDLMVSDKIPFGYNYVDQSFDVTHDHDTQGGHGSHVASIAAANRFISTSSGFADANQIAHTVGVAPDAQLIVMKVFGKKGGAYDSDYMAAIEDAILLGCDSVNLSLGTAAPGFAIDALCQDILESLRSTDTVVTISAGNSYAWPQYSVPGCLYERLHPLRGDRLQRTGALLLYAWADLRV